MSKYKIITLCDSIKYKKEFFQVQNQLTLAGNIVLMPCFFTDESICIDKALKNMLDAMHRQRIYLSDEVFIINVDNYIGKSTKKEIEYAQSLGKKITYLENKGEK